MSLFTVAVVVVVVGDGRDVRSAQTSRLLDVFSCLDLKKKTSSQIFAFRVKRLLPRQVFQKIFLPPTFHPRAQRKHLVCKGH